MHGTSLVNARHARRAAVLTRIARLRRRTASHLPPAVAYMVIPAGAAFPSGRVAGARTVLPVRVGPARLGPADASFYPTAFGASSGAASRPGTGASLAPAPAEVRSLLFPPAGWVA